MTTPTDFPTARRIILLAGQDSGLVQQGDEPTGDQYAEWLGRLTDLKNLWKTQGLKLWCQQDQSITLVAGKATYTMTSGGDVNITKPLRALQGYFLDNNNIRRPIYPMSWDEYLRLSIVTQQGPLTQYFIDKQLTQLVVTFWLTPDATAALGTAHLLLQQELADQVGITMSMQFPTEWFMALRWGLADDICTGQPKTIMDRCAARAKMFRDALEDWDVEDASTSFAPDSRGAQSYGGSRFR